MMEKHEMMDKIIQYQMRQITTSQVSKFLDDYTAALSQPLVTDPLKDRLFKLANDFAIQNQGEVAMKLHTIHNGLE